MPTRPTSKKVNDAHRGLSLAEEIVEHWMFKSEEPLIASLDAAPILAAVNARIGNQEEIKAFFKGQFSKSIKSQWIAAQPDPDYSKKQQANIDSVIAEALAEKPIEEHEKDFLAYQKWESTPESKDVLSKTPQLDIDKISLDAEPLPMAISKVEGIDILEFPQPTSGITSVTMSFDLHGVAEDKLKYLNLLRVLIGDTDVGDLGFLEFSKQSKLFIGAMEFTVSNSVKADRPNDYKSTMDLSFKFLDENRDQAFALIQSLVTESSFEPLDRVKTLSESYKNFKANSVNSGSPEGFDPRVLALGTALAKFQGRFGRLKSEISGPAAAQRIRTWDLDENEIQKEVKALLPVIFNKERLLLIESIALEKVLAPTKVKIADLVKSLPEKTAEVEPWVFADQKDFDAVAIPGDANYVLKVLSFDVSDLPHSGAATVYANYLDGQYLHATIREKGGAYGAGSGFSAVGEFFIYTYRDPKIAESIVALSEFTKFVENEPIKPAALEAAKLSGLRSYFQDSSMEAKVGRQTGLFLHNRTWDSYLERNREIVPTGADDLLRINAVLDAAMATSIDSVSGNRQKIEKEAPQLKEILSMD